MTSKKPITIRQDDVFVPAKKSRTINLRSARKALSNMTSASTSTPEVLRHLIPDSSIAKRYINRQMHGHLDFDMLDYAQTTGMNIRVHGPTGPGKTMLFRAYASYKQIPFLSMNAGSAADPTQLFGKYILQDGGKMVWIDGLVTAAVRHGDSVLLFDEVNFMPAGVTSQIHALTDEQRYIILYDRVVEFEASDGTVQGLPEVISARPGLLVAAAYNEGYRGTDELNEAFCNRFQLAVEWGYSPEVEDNLIASPTLKRIAVEIRKLNTTGEVNTPCSTNRLMTFEKIVDDIGLTTAIENFIAQFELDDQQPIKNVFDLNKDNLYKEYKVGLNRDPDKGRLI